MLILWLFVCALSDSGQTIPALDLPESPTIRQTRRSGRGGGNHATKPAVSCTLSWNLFRTCVAFSRFLEIDMDDDELGATVQERPF